MCTIMEETAKKEIVNKSQKELHEIVISKKFYFSDLKALTKWETTFDQVCVKVDCM